MLLIINTPQHIYKTDIIKKINEKEKSEVEIERTVVKTIRFIGDIVILT